jgi:hypothetical protein
MCVASIAYRRGNGMPDVPATGSHAYLIMAHAQFGTLEKLVRLLDHPRHDLFIHVNARSTDFDPEPIRRAAVRSRVTFVPRRRVNYGGYSVTECALELLSCALSRPHTYYHLLSGMDLPLRSKEEVLSFFDDLDGPLEFVHFSPDEEVPSIRNRMALYHPLQEFMVKPGHPRINLAMRAVDRGVLGTQRRLGVDRLRGSDFELKFGSTWFSITEELAEYVQSRRAWIRQTFRSSYAADEHYLQTLVFNSDFRDRVATRPIRLIDFKRGVNGSPYVWRTTDLPELMSSGCLFARKFDESVDGEVIDEVVKQVSR